MTETQSRPTTASIASRTRFVRAGTAIVGAHFLNDTAVFLLGEEAAILVPKEGDERRLAMHAGAILASAGDGRRIVTGGDDGKVIVIDAGGAPTTVATDADKRWIDQVALGPDRAVAWSAGKTAFVRTGKGEIKSVDAPSSVGGLAFLPKGFRLAVAHYNGISLWFPNAAAKPETLTWKGSHLGITVSPDGKFVVTAMQEPQLHGWRLADGRDMRMSGYAGRVRSMAWTAKGEFLATSGADQIILWPFSSKDGPMGKQPTLLSPYTHRVATVAGHPEGDVVGAGFADGMVVLTRISDGAEILAHPPAGAPATALAFSPDGKQFAFGCEDGVAGVVSLG
jgi:WD40 repeat protein